MAIDGIENEHRAHLGEDLWELAKTFDGSLSSVIPLTTLPSKHGARGSFRLEFDDGTILKGRRFQSEADAERVELLSALLDHRVFPRVLKRRGAGLLIEWVDGRALLSDRMTPVMVKQCGELMGAMHTVELSDDLRDRYGCNAAGWRSRMRTNIDELARRQVLDRGEAHLALRLAEDDAPDDSATGLIHGDFCAENFVSTAQDRLAVVDNETLSIDVYAYDLARTWSRWSMDRQQVAAFYEGYHQYQESTSFREHLLYWATAVLTEAAVFRLRGEMVGAGIPLKRLRALLKKHGP